MLSVQYFGGLTLTWKDKKLPGIQGRITRSLFAYLIYHHQHAHTRDLLIGTFWPERSESAARRRLSQSLWQIGNTLGSLPILITVGDTVQLNPELPLWSDVAAFLDGYHQSTTQQPVDLMGCEASLAYYQGAFLAGYYEDWAIVERERLREIYLDGLYHLIEGHKRHGAYERALLHARVLAVEDPWREEIHREVMLLCHLLGRDDDALKQYELCQNVLREELAVDPSPETLHLAQEIAQQSQSTLLIDLPAPAPLTTLFSDPAQAAELPLVGRETERATLLTQVEALLRGKGSLMLLDGETGVGKTRLLQAIARDAQWRRVEVLWGGGREVEGGIPYGPLGEALNAGLTALRFNQLKQLIDPLWLQVLAPVLPALGNLCPDLEPPPPLEPGQERTRLVSALAELLRGWSQIVPLLLVLEDLHWAGLDTLDLLGHLPAALGELNMLIVGSFRGAEAQAQPRVWEQLQALDRDSLSDRIELSGLDPSGTCALIQRCLGMETAAPLFEECLYQETQGNPLFVLETLRALHGEGLLVQDENGSWNTPWDETTANYAELPLPRAVEQTISRRLRMLSQASLGTLQLAAVLGERFGFDLLEAAGEQDIPGLLGSLRQLVRARFLEETEQDYRFSHAKVRQVAYAEIASPARAALHRQVGLALESLAPDQAAVLAHHWAQAGEWEKALGYHQQAGERARAVYANAEAVAHYSRALSALERLPDNPETKFELLLAREAVFDLSGEREFQAQDLRSLSTLAQALDEEKRADVLLRQAHYAEVTADFPVAIEVAGEAVRWGQVIQNQRLQAEGQLLLGRVYKAQDKYDRARPHYEAGLDLSASDSLRHLKAESLQGLSAVSWQQGNYREAVAFFERGLRIYQEIGDPLGEGDAYGNIGAICRLQGDYAIAEGYHQRALRIAREVGDRQAEGRALMQLAVVVQNSEGPAEAQAYYEKALSIYRSIESRAAEAKVLNGLGIVLGMQGDYPRAREALERALQINDELGSAQVSRSPLHNLGLVCRLLGDFASAQAYYQRSLELDRKTGDPLGESQTLGNLGSLSRCLGKYQEAIAYHQQALVIKRKIGDLQGESIELINLGSAYRHLGDYAQAKKHGAQALEISREIEAGRNEAASLQVLSLIYHQMGDDQEAQTYAQQGLSIAQEIGNRSIQGFSLTSLGHAFTGLGQLAEATTAFQQALDLRRDLGQLYLAMDDLAGLARVAFAQGKIKFAQGHVAEILHHLEGASLDSAEEPIRIYLTCYQVLQAVDDQRAAALLAEAYDLLQTQAARIEDEALRRSFLENVAAHRELAAAYQALQAPAQVKQIVVSLPRAGVPQGRTLREDEYTAVTWTLSTPKDEQIRGKVTRRRQRLLRLLAEAHEQGAVPRDEDLATALDVSLRTLRRDLTALRGQGHSLPPRRRKVAA